MTHELRDLCRQVSADGTLDLQEIAMLWDYVQAQPEAVAAGLPRVLFDRLNAAWLDGRISTGEAFELLDLCSAVADGLSVYEYEDRLPACNTGSSQTFLTMSAEARPSFSRDDMLLFSYRDSAGRMTQRRVLFRSLDDGYLTAICLTRKASRTFRLDRILSDVVVTNTGEVMTLTGGN